MSAEPDPAVTIVVVSYEAREHLLRCLASIRDLAGLPHQVIVVDDGSRDGSAEAVRSEFPEVDLIARSENAGLPAGRNAALPLVRGRAVLMLDSDTELTDGAVVKLLDALDRNPEYGIVAPRLLSPDRSVQPSCRRWPSPMIPFLRRGPYAAIVSEPAAHREHMMSDFDFNSSRPVVSVMGAAQMWRADLPGLIGRFDERVSSYGGEDQDWCARVWRAGLQVVYLPDAEIIHAWQHVVRRRPWSRHSLRALRDFYYLQWKHRGLRSDPRLREAMA